MAGDSDRGRANCEQVLWMVLNVGCGFDGVVADACEDAELLEERSWDEFEDSGALRTSNRTSKVSCFPIFLAT